MSERKYPNATFLADTRTAEGATKVFGSAVVSKYGADRPGRLVEEQR
jgi:hypothetical protein